MASSDKTEHYMLNLWDGTDKPTRSDFVRDNVIIDTALWLHVIDAYAHLTEAEKQRVSQPSEFNVYQGTDEASKALALSFQPRFVLYFAADEPPIEYTSGETIINCCAAVYGAGSTGGCALGSSAFTVYQRTEGTVKYDLNNSDKQYVLIAFR